MRSHILFPMLDICKQLSTHFTVSLVHFHNIFRCGHIFCPQCWTFASKYPHILLFNCFQILYVHNIFRCGHKFHFQCWIFASNYPHILLFPALFSNPLFSVLVRRAAMARPSWETSSPASSRYIL